METHEKEKLLADLESGRKALLDALAGLTDEVAARCPAPGRWSVIECVEHLAVAEEYLFSQLLAAYSPAGPVGNRAREARIMVGGADRSRTMPSPEAAIPKGRFATLAEAVEGFQAARRRTIQYVEDCTGDLRALAATNPIIGAVNCYEMLLVMAVHPLRHAKQVAEIRAALG